MSKKQLPPNIANRDLPADQVVALFKKTLPALVKGLGADRSWLWWSGDKPDEAARQQLGEMGWRFTGKPHSLPDGRVAHWYHSCGGDVIFRRKGRGPAAESDEQPAAENARQLAGARSAIRRHKSPQTTTTARTAERFDPTSSEPRRTSDGLDDFLNFAQGL